MCMQKVQVNELEWRSCHHVNRRMPNDERELEVGEFRVMHNRRLELREGRFFFLYAGMIIQHKACPVSKTMCVKKGKGKAKAREK